MEKIVVLVVEDEALIRINLVQVSEDAGYLVLQACNADEAIEILEQRDDVRAVLTDFGMPGSMDGLRLARAIRGRWPPILLIGSSGRDITNDADCSLFSRFIPKPYQNGQITAALQAVFTH